MAVVRHEHAELYYEVYGESEGPVVVFSHGGDTNALSWWQQVPYFAKKYKVLIFDHRGFGRSKCDELGYLASSYLVEDLKTIMDDAGLQGAALVCQSMGGLYTLSFALKYPDLVRCLVLGHTPAGLNTPNILNTVAGVLQNLQKEENQQKKPMLPWERNSAFTSSDHSIRFLYQQLQTINVSFSYEELITAPERMKFWELFFNPEKLDGFSIPTLVVAGESDTVLPQALMEGVAGLIPGAELCVLPGVGHYSHFEAPVLYNQVVYDFLSAHL
jgi:pimeloyl-ACP methyl ester carboxylesterase